MPSFDYAGKRVEFTREYAGGYDCINKGWFYELTFLEHVRAKNLRGTYLDIGTNIGNHAVYFAMFCPSDRVIGFEPMGAWRARALSNIAANDCNDKVIVHPVGLLDQPAQLEFKPYGTAYTLECTTLDDVLADVSDVSFVKMDIEGSEPKALLGGREFFKRNQPLIYAEVLDDAVEVLAAAGEIGYRHSGLVFRQGCSPMYELVPA